MGKIKLFVELFIGSIFHFYDTPERKLIKSGEIEYLAPDTTTKKISPSVAVFEDQPKRLPSLIYGDTIKDEEGERNEHQR
jgi:hypothetical protein